MAESYKFSHWGSTTEGILATQFPLHRACRDGDIEGLSALLIQAQHGVYAEDNFYGWTPAHWAAYFGKLACLRKLMQVTRVGADCDVKSSRFCQTPAHLAAFGGHPQCLLWLLQSGAGYDCQDYLGETPVHKAARSGSMECISLLISHGAKLFIKNISGQTAAKLGADCGHLECAKYMEVAAMKQENDPRGIYQQHGVPDQPVSASPTDITAMQTGVQLNGAGHHTNALEKNGLTTEQSEESEMDDDCASNGFSHDQNITEMRTTDFSDSIAANGLSASQDVTISLAISRNQLPVAGQKRCREDTEEQCFKRLRTSDGTTLAIHLSLGNSSEAGEVSVAMDTSNTESGQCSSCVLPQEANSDHLEPYQNVLALSCEPLQTPGIEASHNNKITSQYWAFVV